MTVVLDRLLCSGHGCRRCHVAPVPRVSSSSAGGQVRVAVVGLGVMGLPMSLNLVKAGFDVVGFTRTASKGKALIDSGGALADSLGDAVGGAEAVITVLP